ncbi:MAG: hypothetical protein ACRDJ2_05680 [Actinomycetota bacterium]
MAALAYLFPPLTGLLTYALGRDERLRWHGLQSVVFGFAWPALIYAASLAGAMGTRVAFALGALIWIGFFLLTMMGRDPRLPGGRRLRSLAASS